MTLNHSARDAEGHDELAHYISHYVLEEFERMDDATPGDDSWNLDCEMMRGWISTAIEAYEGGAR